MRDSNRADETWKVERRSALKLTAGLIGAGALAGNASAGGDGSKTATCRVKQGGETYEIQPLSGDVPVEELYGYRLPDQYEGVGVTGSSAPFYGSTGTTDLQRESTTIMFLYDGPNGRSLVVIHDKSGGDGGSATWTVSGVPDDASWLVQDDYYTYADSGERAETNYDNWDTGGSEHTVDWTWGAENTDGGALGYLGRTFSLTIHPAFNDEAALSGEHYDGDVTDWQVLSGDLSDPDRTSLALDESVTVSCSKKKKKKKKKGDETGEREKTEFEERRDELKSEIEQRQKEMEADVEKRQEEIRKDVEEHRESVEDRVESKLDERRKAAKEKRDEHENRKDRSKRRKRRSKRKNRESEEKWNR